MPMRNGMPPPTRGRKKVGVSSAKDISNISTRRITSKNTVLNQTGSAIPYKGNATVVGCSVSDDCKEVEDLSKKLSYNDYLESLFLEALVDEKIDQEKNEIDVKMAELAKRLEINKLIIRKTQERLKDISFLKEQQRMLEEQINFAEKIEKQVDEFKAGDLLEDFITNQDMYCNRLLTKHVHLGDTKNSSCEELHSALVQTNDFLNDVKSMYSLNKNEVDTISSISHQLKACQGAGEQIENNLKQHQTIAPQASSNVLEAVSIQLASTLS